MKVTPKKPRSCCSQIHDITIKFDLFGSLLDRDQIVDGLRLYRSIFGTLITIAFFTVLITYSIFKYNAMKLYNDTNIMNSVYESYYDDDYIFKGGKNKFNVAFGLISYEEDSDSGFS